MTGVETAASDKVNILLVDDQPAKLMSYEVILRELNENLVVASSGKEALEQLLKMDVALILVDVCMPELDGFQLAAMIREHPRFEKTAIIFISAVQMSDQDRIRGYAMGAVDYVPVPVVPEVLRAKVRIFTELYRKSRQLEKLNAELEHRVVERTEKLNESEQRLRLSIDIGRLGTWDWNIDTDEMHWSENFHKIIGYQVGSVIPSYAAWRARVHPEDIAEVEAQIKEAIDKRLPFQGNYRLLRPDGTVIWCESSRYYEYDEEGEPLRMIAVVMDVSDHKRSEEHQRLMVRELHHRVKNTLATVQAIASSTARSAPDMESFLQSFADRIVSLSKTHTLLVTNNWEKISLHDLLVSELSTFDSDGISRVDLAGPQVELASNSALSLGMAIHEMTTNAAKYGALSQPDGSIEVTWALERDKMGGNRLSLSWIEKGGPPVVVPKRKGFGSQLIEKVMVAQIGAEVNMRYLPEGLNCMMYVPLEQYSEQCAA